MYWDDAELARELVVRPAPLGEEDDWHWSGGAGVLFWRGRAPQRCNLPLQAAWTGS